MSFAFPLALWSLLFLPVILGLHLIRERKRRYVFSSLRLWSFLEKEVRGSRMSRIPFTWILLVDLLVAALLSLAWAQPSISLRQTKRSAKQSIILLDVSTSMRARDVIPSRFDQAQQQALTLLGELGPQDGGAVVTFGRGSHLIGDTRKISLNELVQRVRDLRPGENGQAFEEGLASAQGLLDPLLPGEIHILTDEAFPSPNQNIGFLPLTWHVFGKTTDNQAVLQISGLQVNENIFQVLTRFANFGTHPANRIVTLLLNGAPVDSASLRLEPGETKTQLWRFVGQPTVVTARLAGSDALAEDDQATTVMQPIRQIQVGLVAEYPEPFDRALRAIPGVRLHLLTPQDYRTGTSFQLTIFRSYLPIEWPAGSVLVVDPPEGSSLLQIDGKTVLKALPKPQESSLLNGIDFSGVEWGETWRVKEPPRFLTSVLSAGDQPVMLQGRSGATQISVLLTDFHTGNLTQHPAFPILLASLVQAARPAAWPASIQAGQALPFPAGDLFTQIRIAPESGNLPAPVEWEGNHPTEWRQTFDPGVYTIDTVDRDGLEARTWLGINAGDIAESNLTYGEWARDFTQASSARSEVIQENRKVSLSPWLLFVTLLFLLLEAWFAWR